MDSYFHLMVDKAQIPLVENPSNGVNYYRSVIKGDKMNKNAQNITEREDLSKQSDEELRHNIAQIQRKWYERKGTSDEHKAFDAILDEILRRRKERQR